jgi:hypothetical protein
MRGKRVGILIMDKAYKTLFLRQVKDQMKARLSEFEPFKLAKDNPDWDVFSGGLLYRKALPSDRFVWVNWFPGSGVERSFNVELGWSLGNEGMPLTVARDSEQFIAMHNARAAIPGIAGDSLDLEQIEGKNAIGGITIPSPWDQLLQVKAAAPQAVQRAAQIKAYTEAQALTEEDRKKAVSQTLSDVFNRIEAQLPAFIASINELPV